MIKTVHNNLFCFQIIKKLIERKREEIRKVRPGLTCFREGVRQIPIESIPGVLDAGLKPEQLKE
jgi:histone acetyltransferase